MSVGAAQGRDILAVVHPWRDVGTHRDCPDQAVDDPHHHGGGGAGDHEVGDSDRAIGGGPPRFEDEGAGAVPALAAAVPVDRRETPLTVVGVPQKRGANGWGVEARQTQPVDRSVAADQGGSAQVADQGVVLNVLRHGRPVLWF
jgi:hypothetical protein